MSHPANGPQRDPARATIANWRATPFSRWAFHNVREIISSVEIRNAPQDIWTLPASPLPLADFNLSASDGPAWSLETFLRATSTDAIVVMRNGRIVYEAYENGNAAHTPHIIMSATKAVVGLTAGILHASGDLEIDAPVSHYVPEVGATAYEGATIRHLLDMRTGVRLDDNQLRAYKAASNWVPTTPNEANAALHAFFVDLEAPCVGHGGPFRYLSANTDLLGWAIERATGQAFASLVSELLWKPMGAEDRAYIAVDRKGAARCAGGLCATVRDFARIGQLVASGGRRGGRDIVPTPWIDDIAKYGDRAAWREGEWAATFAPISTNISYRSGWYVTDDRPQILFAMGAHGQNLYVDRANQIVIAKMSSQSESIDRQSMSLTHAAVAEFRRRLLENPL